MNLRLEDFIFMQGLSFGIFAQSRLGNVAGVISYFCFLNYETVNLRTVCLNGISNSISKLYF